jgi:hypothetical protein
MGWMEGLLTEMGHLQREQHAIEHAMAGCYASAASGRSFDAGPEQSQDDGLLLYVMLVCALHC